MICPNCGYDNLPGSEECAGCLQDLTHLDRPAAHDRIEKTLMEDTVHVLKPVRPVTVQPSTTVSEAIAAMMKHNVGALLVIDKDGMLSGILSERDLLMNVAGHHEQFADLPVSQFMTSNPEAVTSHDKLAFALHKMDGGDYRHLPVVHHGKPIGIFSVRDLLRYVSLMWKDN